MSLPRHRGRFGAEQARRLLWRAGFGPRPGQAERLARLGLDGAVHSLTRPAASRPRGTAGTRPGAVASWRGRLAAGRWRLFCSLPGHERQGMRAVLRVR
jgi:hypothetical protein